MQLLTDAAPASIRANSLAAFDLDPKKADDIAFGARTYRRLRVMLSSEDGQKASGIEADAASDGVGTQVQTAQLEAVDQELFAHVSSAFLANPVGLTRTATSRSRAA